MLTLIPRRSLGQNGFWYEDKHRRHLSLMREPPVFEKKKSGIPENNWGEIQGKGSFSNESKKSKLLSGHDSFENENL